MKYYSKTGIIRIVILILVLTVVTSYVLLDTFVIKHSISHVTSESNELSGEEQLDYKVLNAYSDTEISVILKHYREYGTDIYVADIRLDSPEYLRCAFADDTYGRNVRERTSEMAERVGAIVAVNGDYYGARELGFVIRNGELYRAAPDVSLDSLVIMEDGTFSIISQRSKRAKVLLEEGARHAFTFGPGLLTEGELTVDRRDEVAQSMRSNPRTAIGRVGENHYILLVSDGRTDSSEGLSLYELATFMKAIGAVDAYNLDGGGSSTMYFMGEVVNFPTTDGQRYNERSVSDIVYIGY